MGLLIQPSHRLREYGAIGDSRIAPDGCQGRPPSTLSNAKEVDQSMGNVPHTMQMDRQNKPRVDMERLPLMGFFNGAAKHVDMLNQQVIRASLQKIDRKEKRPSGYAVTAIIQHG